MFAPVIDMKFWYGSATVVFSDPSALRRRLADPEFGLLQIGVFVTLEASARNSAFIISRAKYRIPLHHRKVAESSVSMIIPRGDQRAIVRCRDDQFHRAAVDGLWITGEVKPQPMDDLHPCNY